MYMCIYDVCIHISYNIASVQQMQIIEPIEVAVEIIITLYGFGLIGQSCEHARLQQT